MIIDWRSRMTFVGGFFFRHAIAVEPESPWTEITPDDSTWTAQDPDDSVWTEIP